MAGKPILDELFGDGFSEPSQWAIDRYGYERARERVVLSEAIFRIDPYETPLMKSGMYTRYNLGWDTSRIR